MPYRGAFNVIASVGSSSARSCWNGNGKGIAKAKREGKFKGRKPTARAKTDDVLALRKGGMGATQIGIGRNSVYRILAEKVATGRD